MRCRAGRLRLRSEQRGSVLVLALMLLVGLTMLGLALLSVGALEPQISRNHGDMLRARYLAEAGLEQAYDVLAGDRAAWSTYLTGGTCAAGAVLADAPLPGHPSSDGRFRVVVRNDCAAGDERLTGVAPESGVDDANGTLILASVGRFRDITHRMTAVVWDDRDAARPGQTVSSGTVKTYNWSDQ
jgi:Tfp pilus assembly protein PilX